MREALRHVLIFAHECAPYNRAESTIGAQRPAQFAKHLPEFGWRAIVICCDSNQRRVKVDKSELRDHIRKSITQADPKKSVIIPTPSAVHDGLLDRAWHASNESWRMLPGRQLVRKALTMAKLATGDYSQSWQPCAWQAAEVVAAELPVLACIGEHTPDAGLFLARRYAKQNSVPWIADFRDPIMVPLKPLTRRLYAPLARRLLASASGTINVNDAWTSLDRQLFGLPAWCIPNGFDPEEYPPQAPRAHRGERFVVAYAGSVYQMQRMDVAIQGLSLLRHMLSAEEFKAIRFVYRGDSKQVSQLVEQHGVGDICDLAERTDRQSLFNLLGHADVLLLLSATSRRAEDTTYFGQGFYPGKTFEYFGLRRPILCVPGDGGILDSLIRETATGVVASTPQEVAENLIQSYREWKNGQVIYSPDETVLRRYTRRSQASRLATILDKVLESNPSPVRPTSEFVYTTGHLGMTLA